MVSASCSSVGDEAPVDRERREGQVAQVNQTVARLQSGDVVNTCPELAATTSGPAKDRGSS